MVVLFFSLIVINYGELYVFYGSVLCVCVCAPFDPMWIYAEFEMELFKWSDKFDSTLSGYGLYKLEYAMKFLCEMYDEIHVTHNIPWNLFFYCCCCCFVCTAEYQTREIRQQKKKMF